MSNSQPQSSLSSQMTITKACKLKNLEPIAEGGFGVVYRAVHDDWGVVAYKRLKAVIISPTNRLAKDLVHEAQQHSLRHPNIVALLAITFEREYYGVILEYMKHGSLEDVLSEKVTLCRKLHIAEDITLGMNYLHTRSPVVIHGDLKVQNVLIGDGYRAKICDFGLARWKQYSKSHTSSRTRHGSVTHIPPENWQDVNTPRTVKSDVYAFGVLLWELLSEKKAFGDVDEKQTGYAVEQGQRPDMSSVDQPQSVSPNLKDIIQVCWAQQPGVRPSFAELKNLLNDLVQQADASKENSTRESVDVCDGVCTDRLSNEQLKEKVQQLQVDIVSSVNAASIIDYLFAEKVISSDNMYSLRNINERRGPREQCRELLTLLHNSTHPQAFVQLRLALKDDYSWLVEKIDQLCA